MKKKTNYSGENFIQKLGPGIVTGASDDDPSGIATYSQAGSQFGLGFLWTALLTFPLMASIQEMCGRIGIVTKKGLTSVIKENYSKWLILIVGLINVPAIILNIGANLAGMGAVANLVFPALSNNYFTFMAGIIIATAIVFLPYKRIEQVLKWLCLVLLVYLVVPFLIKQDLGQIIAATIIPHFEFTKEFIAIFVALLGTTISPYLFFWEDSMQVEHYLEKSQDGKFDYKNEVSAKTMRDMRVDSNFGMFISNFIMFFIILTAATVLYPKGINDIETVEQAASALKPLAGDLAYLLFAVGIIGTGFLAIPVLACVCGYIFAEIFGWKEGINTKFKESKAFYTVIIVSILAGLGLNMLNVNPVQALIWSAIAYGVTAPLLIGIILMITNNKKIMGNWVNGKISNFLGIVCFLLMTVAALALLVTSFF
jgi:NRAMP (natural resistance-associated macrophage protein)-like metal ion transporter